MTDQVISLETLMLPWSRELETRIAQARDFPHSVCILEQVLHRFLDTAPSPILAQAIRMLVASKGHARLSTVVDSLGISHRQLERYFIDQVGLSPKLFNQRIRFYRTLQQFSENPALAYHDLVEIGHYYDQAHLIREFKRFSGRTPTVHGTDDLNVAFIQYMPLLSG